MKKKVLIIEDERDMLEMLHVVFQDLGLDIILFDNAISYDEIKSINPDLVLTDVNLRDHDRTGDKICREIKANLDTFFTPVILLSAESNLDAIAHDCLADGYFSKPFDIYELKEYISGKFV